MLLLGALESSGDTCTSESPGKPGEMSFPGALPSDFDLAGLLLYLNKHPRDHRHVRYHWTKLHKVYFQCLIQLIVFHLLKSMDSFIRLFKLNIHSPAMPEDRIFTIPDNPACRSLEKTDKFGIQKNRGKSRKWVVLFDCYLMDHKKRRKENKKLILKKI